MATIRLWVLSAWGSKEPMDVPRHLRVEALRQRVQKIPAVMEESGAWTINGWQTPKIMHNHTLLLDGSTLEQSGIADGDVLCPLYDSQAYSLSVFDPDFYGEMGQPPPLPPCCEHAKDKVADGLAGLWGWTQGAVASVAPRQWACSAGVGLAVAQDDRMRFVVEAVAPGGGADEEGSILVGDVITAVDGEPCLDTAGLDTGAVASLRRLHGRAGSTDTCVAAPSAQGSSAAETGSIVSLEQLQSRLRGLAASHVRIRVARCGGWRQYEVEVRRKVLPSLAASYM